MRILHTGFRAAIFLAAICAGWECRGQARLELSFTNQIASFTNLQGQSFRNAELVSANSKELVFKTNGDYGVVNFTNLSASTFDELGFPPGYLARAQALEQQKAEATARARELLAAEQKRLLDPAALVELPILGITGNGEVNPVYGTVYPCMVRLTNGAAVKAYVARMPAKVPAYFAQAQSLAGTLALQSNLVASASAQLEYGKAQVGEQQHRVNLVNAVTPTMAGGDPYYVDSVMAQRNAVNVAQAHVDYATAGLAAQQESLVAISAHLGDLQAQFDELQRNPPSVMALESRYKQHGVELFICAPDRLQGTNRVASAPQ